MSASQAQSLPQTKDEFVFIRHGYWMLLMITLLFTYNLSGLSKRYIWVSFPRTGICPDLCNFFEKFKNLLQLKQKSNPCFFNSF